MRSRGPLYEGLRWVAVVHGKKRSKTEKNLVVREKIHQRTSATGDAWWFTRSREEDKMVTGEAWWSKSVQDWSLWFAGGSRVSKIGRCSHDECRRHEIRTNRELWWTMRRFENHQWVPGGVSTKKEPRTTGNLWWCKKIYISKSLQRRVWWHRKAEAEKRNPKI